MVTSIGARLCRLSDLASRTEQLSTVPIVVSGLPIRTDRMTVTGQQEPGTCEQLQLVTQLAMADEPEPPVR